MNQLSGLVNKIYPSTNNEKTLEVFLCLSNDQHIMYLGPVLVNDVQPPSPSKVTTYFLILFF